MLMPSIFGKNLFDDVFDDMFSTPFINNQTLNNQMIMNSDIKEFNNKYQLDLELPGFNKEDIQAELKDGYLIVQAQHNESKEDKDENGRYIRKERYTGMCQRSFYVGEGIKQEDIHADFKNGILTLDIPKVEITKEIEDKKYIPIN